MLYIWDYNFRNFVKFF